MIKKFFPVALVLLLLDSVKADASSCGGSIDNSAQAKQAINAANPPSDGDYYFTNYNGGTLMYLHNDQANFLVSTDSLSEILSAIAGQSGTAATNVMTVYNTGVDNTVALMSTAANKCVSAQWGFGSGNCDRFGVAYSCATGPNAVNNPSLNIEKQYWLVIPVDTGSSSGSFSSGSVVSDVSTSSSDSSSSSSSSGYNGCPKDATWLSDHYYDVQAGGYLDRHPACSDLMPSSAPSKRMEKRMKNVDQLQKRGATYMIQAYDHILDMQSECMTGQQVTAFAGAQSSNLAPCDPTDSSQWWTIVPAN